MAQEHSSDIASVNSLATEDTPLTCLKLNNGVETVLSKVLKGHECDLERKTTNGDTLLHCVAHASLASPTDRKELMELIDRIVSQSAKWWCSKKNIAYPDDKDRLQKHKHDAMTNLLTDCKNKKDQNVWKLTFELVAVDMIRKLMFIEGVTCHTTESDIFFDISSLVNFEITWDGFTERISNALWVSLDLTTLLDNAKMNGKLADVLSIQPVRCVIGMYCSLTRSMYLSVVIFHIAYMSVLSYAGCDLMDSRNTKYSETTRNLLLGLCIIEPIYMSLILFYGFCGLMHTLCGLRNKTKICVFLTEFANWIIVVGTYLGLLIGVISTVNADTVTPARRNCLSLALLMGWLLTFTVARGIEKIDFFITLVVKILSKNVLIFLVYVIFLFGFSFSLHAQFISSSNITSTYQTPVHTMYLMFNVMMGMEEAVTETTEAHLDVAGAAPLFSKLIYIGYILCTTIVLLNLLIAMMNTSYSTMMNEHSDEWTNKTTKLGIRLLYLLPSFYRVTLALQHGSIFPKHKYLKETKVWYISLKHLEGVEHLQLEQVNLEHTGKRIENKIDEMIKGTKDVQDKLAQLLQERHKSGKTVQQELKAVKTLPQSGKTVQQNDKAVQTPTQSGKTVQQEDKQVQTIP